MVAALSPKRMSSASAGASAVIARSSSVPLVTATFLPARSAIEVTSTSGLANAPEKNGA